MDDCVTAPHIPGPCSVLYTSNTRLAVSWAQTRGASHYEVQVHDVRDKKERVYDVTVYANTSTEIPLMKVEPNSLYMFYVTASGNNNQIGNTVSCTGVTGMYE